MSIISKNQLNNKFITIKSVNDYESALQEAIRTKEIDLISINKDRNIFNKMCELKQRFDINLAEIAISSISKDTLLLRKAQNNKERLIAGNYNAIGMNIYELINNFDDEHKTRLCTLKEQTQEYLSRYMSFFTPAILLEGSDRDITCAKIENYVKNLYSRLKIYGNAEAKYSAEIRSLVEVLAIYPYVAIQSVMQDYLAPREKEIEFPKIPQIQYQCEEKTRIAIEIIGNINTIFGYLDNTKTKDFS